MSPPLQYCGQEGGGRQSGSGLSGLHKQRSDKGGHYCVSPWEDGGVLLSMGS